MLLKIPLAILKTALVLGAVLLLDHMMLEATPALRPFLPAWAWALPTWRLYGPQ